ncbi:hypothetical protein DFH28DRAFT_923474 [Melampsora americana]|nr:hypothetical protein DFH28DRAFT_923474 [Melampsora americana]
MFGEEESESPRRPSPFLNKDEGEKNPSELRLNQTSLLSSSSSSASFKPKTLSEYLEREMNEFNEDLKKSWRNEIEPEVDSNGHIEYKLKIISPSARRLEKLTTQLKWRLLEGGGIALYEIGVLDDGTLIGLNFKQMEESLSNLNQISNRLNGYIEISNVIKLPQILIQTTSTSVSTSHSNKSLLHQVFKNHHHHSKLNHHVLGNLMSSDRKEKLKQRKKKKKLKSKLSNYNLNKSTKKPIQIAPGDSAVSSESEMNETNESIEIQTESLMNSIETLKLQEKLDRPGRVKKWRNEDKFKSNRELERLGGYLDQICLLTPEERLINKRNLRKDQKKERVKKKKEKMSLMEKEKWDLEEEEEEGEENEIKYVVEVRVLKSLDRFEDERFLDFEGFGIQ